MDRSSAIACYDRLIATNPAVERKGDTVPYTSLNGHMFSALHKDNTVALRLPEKERAAFLKKYKTSLAAHYGVVQPEYVVIPDTLLANTKKLQPYFAASYEYVAGMKPKATAKKSGRSKVPRRK
ncbi:MAG TPA: hypothetical protein VGM20_03295 [Gemmatimonadales bacterium]|jgi:hypothetical protein